MEAQTKSQTPFQRYLVELGDKAAAESLGVPERTVKSWRLGDRIPRPRKASEIAAATSMTLADIYGQ